MKRYVALLRGINISGKNKIAMSELKKIFENNEFNNVKTYLNSGNVIFSSEIDDLVILTNRIRNMIKDVFNLDIPVFVITVNTLVNILDNAPQWWNEDNKEIYYNLIFVIPPIKSIDVYKEIGEPKKGLEKIEIYKEVIFWCFNRKEYRKTNWWSKTASRDISNSLTIRTANTIRKIINM